MSLLLSLLFIATVQEGQQPPIPPPDHPPLPTLPPRSYDIGAGAVVNMSFSFVDTGGTGVHFFDTCGGRCKGNTHILHDKCDDSCDEACEGGHGYTMPPNSLPGIGTNFWGAFEQASKTFGATPFHLEIESAITWETNQALGWGLDKDGNQTLVSDKYVFEGKPGCWVTQPCTADEKYYTTRQYNVVATWSMYRMSNAPDGRQVRVQGPSGTNVITSALVPYRRTFEGQKRIRCACSVIKVGQAPIGVIRDPFGGGGGGVMIGKEPTGVLCDAKTLESANVNVVCQDMVSCSATKTSGPEDMVIAAGTMLIALDNIHQNMMVVSPLRIQNVLNSEEGLFASIRPQVRRGSGTGVEDTGRVVCLNMEKEPPTASVKYKVQTSTDRRLQRLAAFTANQSFKGPWDQARFWIVTDKATYDDVNKRLLPGPTPAMYVRSMYEAATYGYVDFQKDGYRRCLEPKLLIGPAQKAAVEWFVRELAKADSKALAEWVSQNQSQLIQLAGSNAQYLANLITALTSRRGDAVSLATLDLLLALPEGNRPAIMRDMSKAVWSLAVSANERVAERAMDVIAVYKPAGAKFYLYNLPKTASQTNRDRAAKLAKEF